MRILVISNTPWSNDNSFGNSFSNIFEGIEDIEIADIACRPGMPTSYLVKRYYQITEKSLIKNLTDKSFPSGREIEINRNECIDKSFSQDMKMRKFGSKKRWQILFWMRDLIWKFGRWKSQELIDFIDDFNPDVIFQPVYYSNFINDIVYFVKKSTNAPMLGYISDDCYTLKQFSLSPFYWIDRLYKRRKVKRTIEQCEGLYVISDIQKKEYEKLFTPLCKVLTKCADFSDERKPDFKEAENVLKILYAGNISKGRYKILAELTKAIEKHNSDTKKFQLDIYTLTPLTDKQKKTLDTKSVNLHPPVSYAEIREIQKKSDILLHCEGFGLKDKLEVHQSFSTKIVDYLETNRCIFAIGDDYCASIQYFIDNECGAVATKKEDIEKVLIELHENRDLLKKYAGKAWESGKRNHHKPVVQSMVKNDLNNIVK